MDSITKHAVETRDLNFLTYEIRGAIYEVFKELGPGLTEELYEEALELELKSRNLAVARQVLFPVRYKGQLLKRKQRIDLIIEGRVILELKSVEQMHPRFFKQTIGYLRVSKLRLAFLVNFNTELIEDGKSIFRLVNDL